MFIIIKTRSNSVYPRNFVLFWYDTILIIDIYKKMFCGLASGFSGDISFEFFELAVGAFKHVIDVQSNIVYFYLLIVC